MKALSFFKGFAGYCPKCGESKIFDGFLDVYQKCPHCGLNIKNCDSGDGPAFTLSFLLCALVTPLALYIGMHVSWPLYMQALLWLIVIVIFTLLLLRPLKSIFITLHYRYRSQ